MTIYKVKKTVQYIILFFIAFGISGASLKQCQPIEPVFENPYQNYNYWYKGHTHTHTKASDGHHRLPEVAKLYALAGYDFLAITDHNNVGNQESDAIPIVQGCESGDWWENHLIAIGVSSCPEECASCSWGVGLPNCSIPENQKRVNQALNQNGLTILAHPSARGELCFPGGPIEQGWSLNKMINVKGYHAIEIVSGSNISLDEWMHLLDRGRKVWGVASDDFHECIKIGSGWIVVNSNRKPLDKEDIIENIKTGNFYSVRHVGGGLRVPEFTSIQILGGIISVSGRNGRILRFLGKNGSELKNETWHEDLEEFSVTYTASGRECYVRIEVEDRLGNIAYSQPILSYDKTLCESGEPTCSTTSCPPFGDLQCCIGYHCCDGHCYPNSMVCP